MSAALDRCDAVLEMVAGRGEALVTAANGTTALTRFANSAIHQNVAEENTSIHIKVVVNGRYAAATTTQTDEDALRRLVERTLDAARIRPPDRHWPGLAPPAPLANVEHWDEETAAAGAGERAEVVKAFVDAGAGLEGAGFCSTNAVTVAAVSSSGQRVESRRTSATLDGIHRTGSSDAASACTSVRLSDLDGTAAGSAAAARARASAETVELDPGTYEVVLAPTCLADMMQFLAAAGFNGKAFVDGTSFVHLGEQQFDTSVSIWDDATDPRTIGLLFDDEATPKRRIDVGTDGVASGLVHDRRTGAKAGSQSTGHAIAQETLGALPSNLFLGEGDGAQHDLVAGVERGLLVHDFWYTRILDPKTQVVTGLTRNGVFLVEDGQVGPAVRNMRFTQSYVAALGPGKVKAIAGDARLVGSTHVPSIHLAGWNFTGGARG